MSEAIILMQEDQFRSIVTDVVSQVLDSKLKEKPKKFITRAEFAAQRRISMPTADKYIREGRVQIVRHGRRILIKDE